MLRLTGFVGGGGAASPSPALPAIETRRPVHRFTVAATSEGATNARLAISIATPNVIIPSPSAIPACTATAIATSGIDTIATGFLLQDRLTLDVPALGGVSSAEAITRVELGNSLELRNFNFKLESDVGRFEVRGTASTDSVLDVWVNSGSGEQHSQIRLNEPIVLPSAVDPDLAPLDPVLKKALDRDPQARFQTAEEFVEALEWAAPRAGPCRHRR